MILPVWHAERTHTPRRTQGLERHTATFWLLCRPRPRRGPPLAANVIVLGYGSCSMASTAGNFRLTDAVCTMSVSLRSLRATQGHCRSFAQG